MNNSFFDISKEIANDFLQSIVFIDDNAYIEKAGNSHDFDALEITRCFSLSEKFCSILRPTNKEDLDAIIKVAKKSDVVIVDWEMNFVQTDAIDIDDEESIEKTDVRGDNTMYVIKEILSDVKTGKNSLKLIIVYTGTTDLPGITKEIRQHLEKDNFISLNPQRETNNCCLYTENIRIQIVFKGDPESPKFTYNPDLIEQEVTIANLPNFVLNEFTKLTNGLLSNFALKALTELRRNSHRILSLFSKEIDPAYLAHQATLPNIDDANELLVELFKDIIRDLLKNNQLHKFLDKELISQWIEDYIADKDLSYKNGDGDSIEGKYYSRNKELVKNIVLSKSIDIEQRFSTAFQTISSFVSLSNSKEKPKHIKSLSNNCTELFLSNSVSDIDKINKKFAILTHHKNFTFPLQTMPILSLGSVVLSSNNCYYVCIQQRCDSIRINEPRRFLFIKLDSIEGKKSFDFITPMGVKLKLNKKTYDLRTIKFDKSTDGVITSVKENGDYFFYAFDYKNETSEKLKWVFELKDLHAQRIVANYCAELSRVGLDESEWLRLNQ